MGSAIHPLWDPRQSAASLDLSLLISYMRTTALDDVLRYLRWGTGQASHLKSTCVVCLKLIPGPHP